MSDGSKEDTPPNKKKQNLRLKHFPTRITSDSRIGAFLIVASWRRTPACMAKALSVDVRLGDGRHRAAKRRNGLGSAPRARSAGVARWRKQGGDRRSGRIEAEAAFLFGEAAKTLVELREKLLPSGVGVAARRCGVSPTGAASRSKRRRAPLGSNARKAWFDLRLDLIRKG